MFKRMLKIPYKLVKVTERGFQVKEQNAKDNLEKVGSTFLDGYHFVINFPNNFTGKLESVPQQFRGFAYEGAAMALIIQDSISMFKRSRFRHFLEGAGKHHNYMLHIGAGWAYAKFPLLFKKAFNKHDPLLKWLIVDGMGFYYGYFDWDKYINKKQLPRIIKQNVNLSNVYFQGLGRSLWFVKGGDIYEISKTVDSFEEKIRSDLWSGVGLGAAYAGPLNIETLKNLKKIVGEYFPCLAQGIAFAATARYQANTPSANTELVSLSICGMNSKALSELTAFALEEASKVTNNLTVYDNWRNIIQAEFYMNGAGY
ncbi:DUF1702 family protein [Niallia sp. Sow4_A1]|uniref:DUF1702 family protein n=1 Tax=Niallia sp. Sow4_A1 TaxID=3438793 RepID=UPI003F96FFE4